MLKLVFSRIFMLIFIMKSNIYIYIYMYTYMYFLKVCVSGTCTYTFHYAFCPGMHSSTYLLVCMPQSWTVASSDISCLYLCFLHPFCIWFGYCVCVVPVPTIFKMCVNTHNSKRSPADEVCCQLAPSWKCLHHLALQRISDMSNIYKFHLPNMYKPA